MFNTTISTSNLAQQYKSQSWVILDCRSDLLKPEWGYQNYLEGHIPGSFFADLNRDLSASITPQTGRHPLPRPEEFIEKLAHWGVQPGVQVVAVDTANGTFAARIWWMLRALGHPQVAVLEGGYNLWLKEGRPIKQGTEQPEAVDIKYSPAYSNQPFNTSTELLNLLHNPDYKIIDARAPERFRGEVEPIDAVAGRIPGAVNRPTVANLQPDGSLKPAHVLRQEFLDLLQSTPSDHAICYCGSGVTSCHLVLAMEVAGLPGAHLYPGSWSEWIRDPERPIQQG